MTPGSTRAREEFLTGPGEMGERIRSFPWRRTPLGPIESWPQSLKTSVSLLLGSRHPMWIGWGPEATFLYNDAYLHVLGPAKHPQALGQPASKVWEEIWDVCGPLADQVFRHGEASFVDEVRLFMSRGEFLEETFYSFSYSPIRDESGHVGGLFCPSTDVTPKMVSARRLACLSDLSARTLAERTVRATCDAAMAAIEAHPDDLPFALLYLGGESEPWKVRYGATPHFPVAEVLATDETRQVAVPDEAGVPHDAADQPVRQAMVLPVRSSGEGEPYGVLVAGVNPGRPLDEEHRTFFELLAGQLAAAIQNGRTLEEEKQRADMLAEIDRAKIVFFSNVSHEFRTPLTLMLGPLETLLAQPDRLQAEARQHLAIAHRNSLRLLKLVNSLLDFSRIEAGRMQATFAPTDLAALTTDLAANFRSAMEAGGLTLEVDCPPLAQTVYVDREMWEKIVLNLLSNAFKFTFHGSVTVRLREESGQAVLSVADTGIGIPENELPRIFERFHRVEGARGRTYEGTGIGLALIQELARIHGGVIEAQSTVGQGTTFTVRIPLGRAHLAQNRVEGDGGSSTATRTQAFTGEAQTWLEKVEVPAEGSAPGRPVIVLADDNVDMREYVRGTLGASYEILMAGDGRQALELIRNRRPNLVLSDVMMPVLDGLGLLRELRADPATRDLPVIFLSARAGEEMRLEGLGAGADDYLVKPFTANELRARVNTHVQMNVTRQQTLATQSALRAEAEAARDKVIDVLESITDGFMAYDREGRCTYANAEAEKLNGMRREQMVGRALAEMFPDAVDSEFTKTFYDALQRRVPFEMEAHYEARQRWFYVKAYPASNGGLSVFFEDITARKTAESERNELLLREREAVAEARMLSDVAGTITAELDLQKLVQQVTDIATMATGAEFGAFFYNVLNEKGESYVLYSLSGAPREAFEKFGLPRNTPVFEPTFRGTSVVRSDNIMQDPRYGQVAPHHGMPRGHLPVCSYLAAPVISRSGEVLGGLFFGHPDVGVFTERSERLAVGIARHAAIAIDNARLYAQRKEAETRLRDSEQRFRELAEVGPQLIWVSRPDGTAEYVNRQWVAYAGLDESAVMEPFATSVHPDDLPEMMQHWQESLETGTPLDAKVRLQRRDGVYRWFVVRSIALRDEAGRIAKWIGSATDIDEQKRVEDELRRANADLEQFAYSASHDLREPLRSIKIYGELLATRYKDRLDGQALEFLGFLRGGASRMENLIADLLAYTQVTQVEQPQGSTDATEVLETVLVDLRQAMTECSARVTADALPSLPVHRTHLQQLFQNIIGNAIKYRDPHRSPEIHVSARRQGDRWVFSIRDNGIGIDHEYKERIFGLFKRLHTNDEYSGTGIGLAICQRIVDRYHGHIGVESEAGRGSDFHFSLPV